MTRSSKPKNATVWVFLLLLAYIGQMLGVGAHASVMMGAPKEAPAMSSSCHGEGPHGEGHHGMMHQVNELERAVRTDEKREGSHGPLMSCCADNCSMLSCFSVSVILESFDARVFAFSSSSHFFEKPAYLSKVSNSLFRPPIIS